MPGKDAANRRQDVKGAKVTEIERKHTEIDDIEELDQPFLNNESDILPTMAIANNGTGDDGLLDSNQDLHLSSTASSNGNDGSSAVAVEEHEKESDNGLPQTTHDLPHRQVPDAVSDDSIPSNCVMRGAERERKSASTNIEHQETTKAEPAQSLPSVEPTLPTPATVTPQVGENLNDPPLVPQSRAPSPEPSQVVRSASVNESEACSAPVKEALPAQEAVNLPGSMKLPADNGLELRAALPESTATRVGSKKVEKAPDAAPHASEVEPVSKHNVDPGTEGASGSPRAQPTKREGSATVKTTHVPLPSSITQPPLFNRSRKPRGTSIAGQLPNMLIQSAILFGLVVPGVGKLCTGQSPSLDEKRTYWLLRIRNEWALRLVEIDQNWIEDFELLRDAVSSSPSNKLKDIVETAKVEANPHVWWTIPLLKSNKGRRLSPWAAVAIGCACDLISVPYRPQCSRPFWSSFPLLYSALPGKRGGSWGARLSLLKTDLHYDENCYGFLGAAHGVLSGVLDAVSAEPFKSWGGANIYTEVRELRSLVADLQHLIYGNGILPEEGNEAVPDATIISESALDFLPIDRVLQLLDNRNAGSSKLKGCIGWCQQRGGVLDNLGGHFFQMDTKKAAAGIEGSPSSLERAKREKAIAERINLYIRSQSTASAKCTTDSNVTERPFPMPYRTLADLAATLQAAAKKGKVAECAVSLTPATVRYTAALLKLKEEDRGGWYTSLRCPVLIVLDLTIPSLDQLRQVSSKEFKDRAKRSIVSAEKHLQVLWAMGTSEEKLDSIECLAKWIDLMEHQSTFYDECARWAEATEKAKSDADKLKMTSKKKGKGPASAAVPAAAAAATTQDHDVILIIARMKYTEYLERWKQEAKSEYLAVRKTVLRGLIKSTYGTRAAGKGSSSSALAGPSKPQSGIVASFERLLALEQNGGLKRDRASQLALFAMLRALPANERMTKAKFLRAFESLPEKTRRETLDVRAELVDEPTHEFIADMVSRLNIDRGDLERIWYVVEFGGSMQREARGAGLNSSSPLAEARPSNSQSLDGSEGRAAVPDSALVSDARGIQVKEISALLGLMRVAAHRDGMWDEDGAHGWASPPTLPVVATKNGTAELFRKEWPRLSESHRRYIHCLRAGMTTYLNRIPELEDNRRQMTTLVAWMDLWIKLVQYIATRGSSSKDPKFCAAFQAREEFGAALTKILKSGKDKNEKGKASGSEAKGAVEPTAAAADDEGSSSSAPAHKPQGHQPAIAEAPPPRLSLSEDQSQVIKLLRLRAEQDGCSEDFDRGIQKYHKGDHFLAKVIAAEVDIAQAHPGVVPPERLAGVRAREVVVARYIAAVGAAVTAKDRAMANKAFDDVVSDAVDPFDDAFDKAAVKSRAAAGAPDTAGAADTASSADDGVVNDAGASPKDGSGGEAAVNSDSLGGRPAAVGPAATRGPATARGRSPVPRLIAALGPAAKLSPIVTPGPSVTLGPAADTAGAAVAATADDGAVVSDVGVSSRTKPDGRAPVGLDSGDGQPAATGAAATDDAAGDTGAPLSGSSPGGRGIGSDSVGGQPDVTDDDGGIKDGGPPSSEVSDEDTLFVSANPLDGQWQVGSDIDSAVGTPPDSPTSGTGATGTPPNSLTGGTGGSPSEHSDGQASPGIDTAAGTPPNSPTSGTGATGAPPNSPTSGTGPPPSEHSDGSTLAGPDALDDQAATDTQTTPGAPPNSPTNSTGAPPSEHSDGSTLTGPDSLNGQPPAAASTGAVTDEPAGDVGVPPSERSDGSTVVDPDTFDDQATADTETAPGASPNSPTSDTGAPPSLCSDGSILVDPDAHDYQATADTETAPGTPAHPPAFDTFSREESLRYFAVLEELLYLQRRNAGLELLAKAYESGFKQLYKNRRDDLIAIVIGVLAAKRVAQSSGLTPEEVEARVGEIEMAGARMIAAAAGGVAADDVENIGNLRGGGLDEPAFPDMEEEEEPWQDEWMLAAIEEGESTSSTLRHPKEIRKYWANIRRHLTIDDQSDYGEEAKARRAARDVEDDEYLDVLRRTGFSSAALHVTGGLFESGLHGGLVERADALISMGGPGMGMSGSRRWMPEAAAELAILTNMVNVTDSKADLETSTISTHSNPETKPETRSAKLRHHLFWGRNLFPSRRKSEQHEDDPRDFNREFEKEAKAAKRADELLFPEKFLARDQPQEFAFATHSSLPAGKTKTGFGFMSLGSSKESKASKEPNAKKRTEKRARTWHGLSVGSSGSLLDLMAGKENEDPNVGHPRGSSVGNLGGSSGGGSKGGSKGQGLKGLVRRMTGSWTDR